MERNIMEKRSYEEDKYRALYTLQRMHDKLENWEIFPESLVNEGKKSIRNLAEWVFDDEEMESLNKEYINLLFSEIQLSNKLKQRRNALWSTETSRMTEKL